MVFSRLRTIDYIREFVENMTEQFLIQKCNAINNKIVVD